MLLFFREDTRLPNMMVVPPTSIKAIRDYVLTLIDAGKRVESVRTKLSIVKAQNAGGISYSQLALSYDGDLPEGDASQMIEIGKDLSAMMASQPMDVAEVYAE